jgi:hypothetical protein
MRLVLASVDHVELENRLIAIPHSDADGWKSTITIRTETITIRTD